MIVRFNLENKIKVKLRVSVNFYIYKNIESVVEYDIDPLVLKFIAPEEFMIGTEKYYYHVHSITFFEEGQIPVHVDRSKFAYFDKTPYDELVTISICKANDEEYKLSCR